LESPVYGKAWKRWVMGTNVWSENLKEKDFVVGLGENLRVILKVVLKL
jgi:hypothetical protein